MRAASIASLVVGLGLGFAPMYIVMQKRAPEVLKAMPSHPVRIQRLEARFQQLQEELKKDSRSFEVLAEIGDTQFDLHRYNEASDWYTKALAVGDSLEVRQYLGIALLNQNRYDEAIAQFNKVLTTAPSNPDALLYVGLTLLKGKDDSAGAIEVWEKLIQLNPNYSRNEDVRGLIQGAKEKLQ